MTQTEDFTKRALRAAINAIETNRVERFRDLLIDAIAAADCDLDVFEAALHAFDSAIASMRPTIRWN